MLITWSSRLTAGSGHLGRCTFQTVQCRALAHVTSLLYLAPPSAVSTASQGKTTQVIVLGADIPLWSLHSFTAWYHKSPTPTIQALTFLAT